MILITLIIGACSLAYGNELTTTPVNVSEEMKKLISMLDRDGDRKITVNDHKASKAMHFDLHSKSGQKLAVDGVYHLSNLLQELKLAEEERRDGISAERLYENPVLRISRSIKDRYWDGLTRRIDKDHLQEVLNDPKIAAKGPRFLYVPYHDLVALEYFLTASAERPELELKVVRLPEKITGDYVLDLEEHHGLLALALMKNPKGEVEGVPYVVPGGRFNEMYGWDSYFEALGLIADGRIDLARAMVDNFVYQITHYGKILNANRTYYLTRSQPPFLTSMIRAVLPHVSKEEKKTWLANSLKAAVKEYHSVWMGEERLTKTGLSRYSGEAPGIPPEVEAGHFDHIIRPMAKKRNLSLKEFKKRYNARKIQVSELDDFLRHDRAVRESGHDTTYRWRMDGKDRAADFVTVDLNALLYKFELDLAWLIEREFDGRFENLTAVDFRGLARRRKEGMLTYLWDTEKQMFFDYYLPTGKRSSFLSATTLWPLWAMEPGMPETRILTDEQAINLVNNALNELEERGGIAATSKASLLRYGDKKHARQWDWPNGWAPHQMLAWQGLLNYGHFRIAQRLIYKWLYMITKNAADYNGTVPEKYDVVERSHAVFAEYGNVGTQFSYITREGFGWMNASYQVGLSHLSLESRALLERIIPPEWVIFK